VFYTHYRSRKGRELEENPQAMLLFCWTELERQVGIEGRVARVSARNPTSISQAGPWQPAIGDSLAAERAVASREALETGLEEASKRLARFATPPGALGRIPPRSERFEFWQGRKDRLHDRCATAG